MKMNEIFCIGDTRITTVTLNCLKKKKLQATIMQVYLRILHVLCTFKAIASPFSFHAYDTSTIIVLSLYSTSFEVESCN